LPAARYVEVQQAGHMAPLEQPAIVNEALAAFMRASLA
jgi:pimeloyl-ACP methyl ester carboxylesterase